MKIHDFLEQIAADVVDTQKTFDDAYLEECKQFLPHWSGLEQVEQLLGKALLPNRMLIVRQEFKCSLDLQVSKSRGFELSCQTIPLKYAYLMTEEATLNQDFQIQIEQITLTENPFNK